MDRPRGEYAPQNADQRPSDWPSDPAIQLHEPRNLVLLALHQIVFRIAWMFKTESVIIPAFLDFVSGPGAGGLRGCLPVLNRLGQSVLPVWFAGPLARSRRQGPALDFD